MKILYRQPDGEQTGSLGKFGISNCYFKALSYERDMDRMAKSEHRHCSFELHIVTEGYQEYLVAGKSYRVESGSFLLIYPNVPHIIVDFSPKTQKYSATFNRQTAVSRKAVFGEINGRIRENIDFICAEASHGKEISSFLVENSILETVVQIFRIVGDRESDCRRKDGENAVVALARQYVDDNIERAPTVADLAAHCYLSPKQLTRLFNKYLEMSPGEYVISRRIAKTEKLLADSNLSLKQISVLMSFESEYYFNTFFKKYTGMPPGEYRKIYGE